MVRLRAAQDVRAHVRPPLHDSTTVMGDNWMGYQAKELLRKAAKSNKKLKLEL